MHGRDEMYQGQKAAVNSQNSRIPFQVPKTKAPPIGWEPPESEAIVGTACHPRPVGRIQAAV